MNKKNLKILLVCIVNRNYGDTIIADCTEFLIRKALGKNSDENSVLRYKIDCGDLWQIQFADAIVFAGGGLLKFRQEKFYTHVCHIIEEAEKHNIPVFMNSVGVEGYDGSDERCTLLKDHVNYTCVKGISVRDDYSLMKEQYKVRPDLRVKNVFDPAVWVKDVYGGSEKAEDTVGINVARGDLFPDYGNEQLDEAFMLDFWSGIIDRLEKNDVRWKVFTNGGKGDEAFAMKLMEKTGHGEKLPAPKSGDELVRMISGFSSLIALRMHACITAYSLGIPCVGLVWNDKLRIWSDMIKKQDCFISAENIAPEAVFDMLMKVKSAKIAKPAFFKKYGTYYELKRFIGKFASNRNVGYQGFSEKLFEVGLGGIQHRHKAPNSTDELQRRLREGCRFFEVDVRADTEGKAVCINGWSDKNLRLMGLEPSDSQRRERSLDEVRSCRIEDAFMVGGLDDVCGQLLTYSSARLIIDVGLPPADLKEPLFKNIASILKENGMDSEKTFIRLQREGDVKLWIKQKCDSRMIYFYPEGGDTEEGKAKQDKNLDICKKYGIKYISVSEKNFTEVSANAIKEKKLKPIIFSYDKLGDAAAAVERGAYLVGSFYYSASYAAKLIAVSNR